MKLTVFAVVSAISYALCAAEECHHDHDHEADHDHEHAAEKGGDHDHDHEHSHGNERGVEVSDAAAAMIGLKTAKVEMRRLVSTRSFIARAVPAAGAERIVSSPLAGELVLSVKAPVDVKVGDELFRIVSSDAAAKYAELRSIEARLAALESAGAKNAALTAECATLRGGYYAITNGVVVLDAAAGRFAVRSPVDGQIVSASAVSGGYCEKGAQVLRIVSSSLPSLFGVVPHSETVGWKSGGKSAARGVEGTIRLDRTRTDGLVGVWFDVKPGSKWDVELGETVMVDVALNSDEKVVPAVADKWIFRDGITPSVFVRDHDDPDRFVVKAVSGGKSANGWTEATGLTAEDEVVSVGAYELKLALAAAEGSTRKAGHFHADGKFHEGGEEDEQ